MDKSTLILLGILALVILLFGTSCVSISSYKAYEGTPCYEIETWDECEASSECVAVENFMSEEEGGPDWTCEDIENWQ